MFTYAQLRELERQLKNRKVLSVFIDTSSAAAGPAWRMELNRALARLEATPPRLPEGERTARELCVGHLRAALEGMRETPGRPGWAAYVTTDDVVAAGPVRDRVETKVCWQNGIVVRPMARAPGRTPVPVTPGRPVESADLVSV